MNRIKSIIFLVLVIITLFFSLKGCIKTSYDTISYKAYERVEEDGQLEKIFLLPKNKMMLIKSVPEMEAMEAGLYKIYGTKGTNYFWHLWNISESGSPLGIRWIPDAESVWRISLEFRNSIGIGISDTSFPNRGKKFETTFTFYEDAIKIGTLHYNEIPVNEKAIMEFFVALEKVDES